MRLLLFPEEWIRPWWLGMFLCYSATIINAGCTVYYTTHYPWWVKVLANIWILVFSFWYGRGAATAARLHRQRRRCELYGDQFYDGL